MRRSIFDGNPAHEPTAYTTINDVPVPLRATIVELHIVQAMPPSQIAAWFNIPTEWVQLLIGAPPGSTAH